MWGTWDVPELHCVAWSDGATYSLQFVVLARRHVVWCLHVTVLGVGMGVGEGMGVCVDILVWTWGAGLQRGRQKSTSHESRRATAHLGP